MPLHPAVEIANNKIMAMLLEMGAEVEAEDSSSNTIFFSAVWARKLSCVSILFALVTFKNLMLSMIPSSKATKQGLMT